MNHDLKESDLDYSIAESYIADFERVSHLSHGCFFIVDIHKIDYIYTSDGFKSLFGYVPNNKAEGGLDNELLDSKIHPDDFVQFKKIMPKVGEFLLAQPKSERINVKHVFELRVQNIQKQYIRVSWERQALATDKSGNLWLMLGIIHPLPEQNSVTEVKSYFINLHSGEHIPFNFSDQQPMLTKREQEVLQLIQQGLLSKEIAQQMSISIHTVHVYRQSIHQKMNVNNALEAVRIGRKHSLLE